MGRWAARRGSDAEGDQCNAGNTGQQDQQTDRVEVEPASGLNSHDTPYLRGYFFDAIPADLFSGRPLQRLPALIHADVAPCAQQRCNVPISDTIPPATFMKFR